MNLPWLPETRLLLVRETQLIFLRLRASFRGICRVVGRWEYPLETPGELRRATTTLSREHRVRFDDLFLLGLPLEVFTIIHFNLPLAVAENLEEAVGFEILRHLPAELDNFYWRYRCQEEDGHLRITVILADRQEVYRCLTACQGAGINLSAVFPSLFLPAWVMGEPGLYFAGDRSVFELLLFDGEEVIFQAGASCDMGLEDFLLHNLPLAENRGIRLEKLFAWKQPASLSTIIKRLRPELELVVLRGLPDNFPRDWSRFPYSIDLISPEVLRRQRFWFKFEITAACFLLFSMLGLPVAVIAGKTRHLRELETHLTTVRQQAGELKEIRTRNREILERFEVLGRLIREHVRTIDILKELTEVLPRDTWLRSLSIKEGRIYLQGISGSATNAVKALEDSPLFKEVHFDSPVIKRGNKETFRIVVDLE